MKLGDPVLLQSALGMALQSVSDLPHFPPIDRLTRHQAGLQLLQNAQFSFRSLQEAENLSCLLAACFPEPDRVIQGIAELMFNAVEHGNLAIGSALKAELCSLGSWRTEIERRLSDPRYMDRTAEATITRRDGGTYVIITDQGQGFDWKNYLQIDPARAGQSHGRGIAMARSVSFDKLTYNDSGNKAVAFVADSSTLNW